MLKKLTYNLKLLREFFRLWRWCRRYGLRKRESLVRHIYTNKKLWESAKMAKSIAKTVSVDVKGERK